MGKTNALNVCFTVTLMCRAQIGDVQGYRLTADCTVVQFESSKHTVAIDLQPSCSNTLSVHLISTVKDPPLENTIPPSHIVLLSPLRRQKISREDAINLSRDWRSEWMPRGKRREISSWDSVAGSRYLCCQPCLLHASATAFYQLR